MGKDEKVKTAEQLANEYVPVDRTETFEKFRAIIGDLHAQIDERFELKMDPSTQDLQPFEAESGAARGFVSNFSGEQIDWLVDSWIGKPETGFANTSAARAP